MTIDLSKKYRTRDGREVRILCTDAPGKRPVVGYVPEGEGFHHASWNLSGVYQDERNHPYDLVEVREKRRLHGWLNVHDVSCYWYSTKRPADSASHFGTRIACIDLSKYEYEVGEGLE